MKDKFSKILGSIFVISLVASLLMFIHYNNILFNNNILMSVFSVLIVTMFLTGIMLIITGLCYIRDRLLLNKDLKSSSISNVDNRTKGQKPKKKKILIIVFLILIIGGIGVGYYNSLKQKNEYVELFNTTYDSITLEGNEVEQMCSNISDAWNNAIFVDEVDFNGKIAELNQQWQDDGTLKDRENAKNSIESNMSKLKNPPKDYQESYKLLFDLYSKYEELYNQATSPTGSLTTYNQDINDKSNEFNSLLNKLKVTIPKNN